LLLIASLFMEKYKIIKTLGDGAFGTVFKASNINTG
jgi:serine/threonine protein kinase